MGSSVKRKPNDAVRISIAKPNTPTNGTGNGGSTGGGVGTAPIDINVMCPVRFRVKLTRQDLAAGIALTVNDANELVASGLGVVGKLRADTTKRLEQCSGAGIAYNTVLTVIDRGVCYAEFSQ